MVGKFNLRPAVAAAGSLTLTLYLCAITIPFSVTEIYVGEDDFPIITASTLPFGVVYENREGVGTIKDELGVNVLNETIKVLLTSLLPKRFKRRMVDSCCFPCGTKSWTIYKACSRMCELSINKTF